MQVGSSSSSICMKAVYCCIWDIIFFPPETNCYLIASFDIKKKNRQESAFPLRLLNQLIEQTRCCERLYFKRQRRCFIYAEQEGENRSQVWTDKLKAVKRLDPRTRVNAICEILPRSAAVRPQNGCFDWFLWTNWPGQHWSGTARLTSQKTISAAAGLLTENLL